MLACLYVTVAKIIDNDDDDDNDKIKYTSSYKKIFTATMHVASKQN